MSSGMCILWVQYSQMGGITLQHIMYPRCELVENTANANDYYFPLKTLANSVQSTTLIDSPPNPYIILPINIYLQSIRGYPPPNVNITYPTIINIDVNNIQIYSPYLYAK